MSHATKGHPERMGQDREFWQNVVHWRREWQATSVFLPWEPHEQYEKAKRYDTEGKKKKLKSSTKTSASDLLTTPKPLTVWITTNCGEFFKRWEYQTTLSASWEICMQVRKQQLELDMEQQAGSKLGKEYIKTVYCHPAYLAYMQSISYKMTGWMKHKLESTLPEEISRTSDMEMTPPLWQKVKRN